MLTIWTLQIIKKCRKVETLTFCHQLKQFLCLFIKQLTKSLAITTSATSKINSILWANSEQTIVIEHATKIVPNTKTYTVKIISIDSIKWGSKTIQVSATSQKYIKLTPKSIKCKAPIKVIKRQNIKTIKATLLSWFWHCWFEKKDKEEILILVGWK